MGEEVTHSNTGAPQHHACWCRSDSTCIMSIKDKSVGVGSRLVIAERGSEERDAGQPLGDIILEVMKCSKLDYDGDHKLY